jgi:hypothetical protein
MLQMAKIKVFLYLIKHVWRSGGSNQPFLTSVLHEGDRSASRPGHFITSANLIEGWVILRAPVDAVKDKVPCL